MTDPRTLYSEYADAEQKRVALVKLIKNITEESEREKLYTEEALKQINKKKNNADQATRCSNGFKREIARLRMLYDTMRNKCFVISKVLVEQKRLHREVTDNLRRIENLLAGLAEDSGRLPYRIHVKVENEYGMRRVYPNSMLRNVLRGLGVTLWDGWSFVHSEPDTYKIFGWASEPISPNDAKTAINNHMQQLNVPFKAKNVSVNETERVLVYLSCA